LVREINRFKSYHFLWGSDFFRIFNIIYMARFARPGPIKQPNFSWKATWI
jgi:hypothetical protein